MLEAREHTEAQEEGEEGAIEVKRALEEETEITSEELIEAILELKNGKAPGKDGVTAEMVEKWVRKEYKCCYVSFTKCGKKKYYQKIEK